jgi:phosphonopyruvate decarboxylase
MIDPGRFVDHLGELGIELYTGVPDSLLKHLCAHIMRELPRESHVITANEGAAVGVAIGHYLRSGDPALVYLQNSGFGNTVNPLLSLADPDVYGVPMVLLVGWRGQPGVKDEPQHVKQGRVMEALVDALELPRAVLPTDEDAAAACMRKAAAMARERSCPYVVLVEKDTFAPSTSARSGDQVSAPQLASREDALIALVDALGPETINVSTTGMLSRELFEYRTHRGESGDQDFLTVGGMGHCSSIALGIAMQEPDREVWCLDGDGALLMHLGSLAVIADHGPPNLFHVVFNNGVHDSVGGQPTSIAVVDMPSAAQALGYRSASSTSSLEALDDDIAGLRKFAGPSLLEVRVRPGSRRDIGRPTRSPSESKAALMTVLERRPPAQKKTNFLSSPNRGL